MEYNDEKIVKLLQFVLNFYGIYPFIEDTNLFQRRWFLSYSYASYATMVIGNLTLIIFSPSIDASIRALSVIIGTFYFFFVQFQSAHKCENLRKLILAFRTSDVRWLTFIQNLRIKRRISDDRIVLIHHCIAAYNIFSYTMVLLFPILSVWSFEISEIGEPASLLFTCWYPWNVKNIRWYLFTYFIQSISGILFQIILYTSTAFNLIVLCLFKNYFNELKVAISHLKFARNAENFNYDLEYCIRRHQNLTRIFNEYKSWFDVLYAAELMYYSLEFLFLGTMAFSISTDITYQTKSFLLLANITMSLYIHCWIGEVFYSLNDSLSEILYSLPWYDEKFKIVRKNLCMFMSQTQYPLRLTGFRIFQASLQVFFSILRTSYGYLSLLLATLK